MTYLPDVNFWLGLTFESHVHYARAKDWFDSLSADTCVFCRLTQQGLLRLATNPSAFGEDAVTLSEAWQILDMLLGDPRISFADETPGIELYWREYTRQRTFSPKVWNDAYLAAFARAANYDLVTFDRAFSQYGGLKCMILS